MHLLSNELWFPSQDKADKDGLLAIGGDLSMERLLLAYNNGIFPWFNKEEPPLWWSPDPRMVIAPENVYVSKSMRKLIRNETFRVTYNQDFLGVISACRSAPRKDQYGTWITQELIGAYLELFEAGRIISVEVWKGNTLAGGLYGINLKEKGVFCGESMFAHESNASKYGFIMLSRKLQNEGCRLIDCQIYTDHLASLGATEIPRTNFLAYLNNSSR